jgi:hypothetical protein
MSESRKPYRVPDIGPEPLSVPGDCVGCRQWCEELFIWRLQIDGVWDRWRLCQACRSTPRAVLTARVQRDIEMALPILEFEPGVLSPDGLRERRSSRRHHNRRWQS